MRLGNNGDQSCAESRHRRAGVGGIQADFCVSQPDVPAAGYVVAVAAALERFTEPGLEAVFKTLDLSRPAGNHAGRLRVPLDRSIEIVDQCL